jgi:chromosomal replication initiation ATPase DnaA
LTARTAVAEWPYQTNDVKSRARLAAHFSLTAPDDILLSQMFVKLFADRQLSVDPKVISYLIGRMERSSEEVVALVELLDRLSLSRGRAITRTIAAEALSIRSKR